MDALLHALVQVSSKKTVCMASAFILFLLFTVGISFSIPPLAYLTNVEICPALGMHFVIMLWFQFCMTYLKGTAMKCLDLFHQRIVFVFYLRFLVLHLWCWYRRNATSINVSSVWSLNKVVIPEGGRHLSLLTFGRRASVLHRPGDSWFFNRI